MPPITLYTNLFTIKGRDPAANQYVKVFMVWLTFVEMFAGADKVIAAIDSTTFEYIKTVPKYISALNKTIAAVDIYEPPDTLIDGMAMRYFMGMRLQEKEPNRLYMYLDVDVLPVRHLLELFVGEVEGKIHIATEEYLKHCVGDIFHCYYLDGRIELTPEQKERVGRFGGISSGMFAWHLTDGGNFFRRILFAIWKDKQAKKEFIHTIDQPYFNEQVIRLFLEDEKRISAMPSDRFGFNAPFGASQRHVLLNYAGNVGDDAFHFQKIEQFYDRLFG